MAIEDRFPDVLPEKIIPRASGSQVRNILRMFGHFSTSIENLDETDQDIPALRFSGFDANDPTDKEFYSIFLQLSSQMGEFGRFSGSANSNGATTMIDYRRLYEAYEPFKDNPVLNLNQLLEIRDNAQHLT